MDGSKPRSKAVMVISRACASAVADGLGTADSGAAWLPLFVAPSTRAATSIVATKTVPMAVNAAK